MKKIAYAGLFGLLITGMIFSGCKKIEEATEIKFDATYHADLDVNVSEAARSFTFMAQELIDPVSDPNVKKYIDKIKAYDILQVDAEVLDISKDVTLVAADLDVYSDANKASWHLENLPLTKGAKISLDNENGQWDTVKKIFEEKTAFTVKLGGETSEGGVSFIIRVTIKTKITANPL